MTKRRRYVKVKTKKRLINGCACTYAHANASAGASACLSLSSNAKSQENINRWTVQINLISIAHHKRKREKATTVVSFGSHQSFQKL